MQGQPTSNLFRFLLEDRIQCKRSGCVSYRRAPTNVLGLPIPLDAAVNKEQLEQYKVHACRCGVASLVVRIINGGFLYRSVSASVPSWQSQTPRPTSARQENRQTALNTWQSRCHL